MKILPLHGHVPGACDAETQRYRRWKVHALLWSPIQAGLAGGTVGNPGILQPFTRDPCVKV